MKWIKHIPGEMMDAVQLCIICGDVIGDYKHAMSFPPSPPLSWPMGLPIYMTVGVNPQITVTSEPNEDIEFEIENCKPN